MKAETLVKHLEAAARGLRERGANDLAARCDDHAKRLEESPGFLDDQEEPDAEP